MITIHPEKVAIYIRWSTEDQGQGHTLQIQQESCRYYCLAQGWAPSDTFTYIDDGYSGGSLERPALTRLREAVTARQVDCVVVYKLDRLSRNIKDIINLVLDEWDECCAVRSTQEPVETTSDAGRMFFTMLGSFADFERSTIKSRTWSGKRKNAEHGKNPGMLYPYGLAKGEDGGWALVETEAAVVRRLFEEYIRGASCRSIAFGLNEEGLRTRSGRRWSDADISRLLRNPLYAGKLLYNRRSFAAKRKHGAVVATPAEEVITCEGAVPAIVSGETWELARQVRLSRPRVDRSGSPRSQSSPHLLSGLLKCSCGRSWISFRGGKQREAYYTCAGARTGGPAVCASRSVQAGSLEAFVLAKIRERWALKGEFDPHLLADRADKQEALDLRIKALRQRLAGLEAAALRFRMDYKHGKLPADLFAELTAENRHEQAELQANLASAEAERNQEDRAVPDLAEAGRQFQEINLWAALSETERQQVLRLLVREIRVSRPKGSQDLTLHIDWRLPLEGGTENADSVLGILSPGDSGLGHDPAADPEGSPTAARRGA